MDKECFVFSLCLKGGAQSNGSWESFWLQQSGKYTFSLPFGEVPYSFQSTFDLEKNTPDWSSEKPWIRFEKDWNFYQMLLEIYIAKN